MVSPRAGVAPLLIASAVSIAACGSAFAEKLPIRTYTTLDGLADDGVRKIVVDSHGFLWFCTGEGISRFDGREFRTFATADGLEAASVRDMIEIPGGRFVLGTTDGVVLFDPSAERDRFVRADTPGGGAGEVLTLLLDTAGRIWVGTYDGLFTLRSAVEGPRVEPVPRAFDEGDGVGPTAVQDLVEDRSGNLWIAHTTGMYHLDRNLVATRLSVDDGLPADDVRTLAVDSRGRIWAGTTSGVALVTPSDPEDPGTGFRVVSLDLGNEPEWVYSVFESTDGRIWIATVRGVFVLDGDDVERRDLPRLLSRVHGLASTPVTCSVQDPRGDLWFGTSSSGAMRLAARGLSYFGRDEGLEPSRIASLFLTRRGRLCSIASPTFEPRMFCFDGDRFLEMGLGETARRLGSTWGWNQISFQDHAGEWWIATGRGLVRYPTVDDPSRLARTSPIAVYTTEDGLPHDYVFRLYEDRAGDIWISLMSESPPNLARWERASGEIDVYPPDDRLPFSAPSAFAEDRAGNLWIGLYIGSVVRFRAGRFERFAEEHGCPPGSVRSLHVDSAGRLWIATQGGGLARVDDPSVPEPSFDRYTRENGLSSNIVSCVTEDLSGRLYFGTSRGVDRLDPVTGRFRRLTTADGLPNSYVNVAIRDDDGNLWFGTLDGIARLVPGEESPLPPPGILISGVRTGGTPIPVSAVGTGAMLVPPLSHDTGPVEIDFLSPGQDPTYRYRVVGAQDDWSSPTTQRTVHLAGLSPGDYRFEVVAVGIDGVQSENPATVGIVVLPPIWRRAWFVVAIACLGATAAVTLHRLRLSALRRRASELSRLVGKRTADLENAKAQLEDANLNLERRVREGIEALREAERMAAYGNLVASVAHEVRHPIFSLQAAAYVLADRLAGQEGLEKQLRVVDRETRRMSDLMNDLLQFARPGELSPETTHPRRLLADAVETFAAAHQNEDFVKVTVDVPDSLPTVSVDRSRLLQVLVNLMENARQHATGMTTIALRARMPDGPTREVWIEVADDGDGIPDERLPHIFEPFYTGGKGTGLGLAIVRRIVTDHGGRIQVDSRRGRGTTFTVALPADAPA